MAWTKAVRMSSIAIFASGAVSGLVVSGSVATALQRGSGQQDMKALDGLVAKDQIRDQIYNYSRGLDRMDRPLALQVFHPDSLVTQPGPTGGGFKGTGAEWVAHAWSVHEKIAAHTHQMTNTLIKVNGDKASSETYAMASLRAEPTPTESNTQLIRVRYVDTWSRRSGRWAIDTRNIVVDFTTADKTSGPNRGSVGHRDKTDPSYAAYF